MAPSFWRYVKSLLPFTGTRSGRAKRPERPRLYRLGWDILEDRTLPATMSLSGSTLTITFDSMAAASMSGTPSMLTFDAGTGHIFILHCLRFYAK